MTATRPITAIILAAGKGTRMQSPNVHKVCLPVDGKPVIVRALETYQRAGLAAHLLVVGQQAEQVMRTASAVPAQVMYAFQAEQRGTGHATRVATDLLEAHGYQGDIMIVAGDKVLEEAIVARLLETFYARDCELAFVVGEAEIFTGSGRIVIEEDGRIIGNVETFDIARMRLLINLRALVRERPLSPEDAERLARAYFSREEKAAVALGAVWEAIKLGRPIDQELLDRNFTEADYHLRINGRSYSPAYLDRVRYANLSVYLVKGPVLYRALRRIGADNAQNEVYLTDVIGVLAAEGAKVDMVPLRYPEEAMAFNTPEELQAIEAYYSARRQPAVVHWRPRERKVREWQRLIGAGGHEVTTALEAIYGEGRPAVEQKRQLLLQLLADYRERYGDGAVVIARAPSRVNLMGRHVDHQGGMNNHVALDRDLFIVAGRREDRRVHIANLDARHFAERAFTLDEMMAGYTGQPWLDFVSGPEVTRRAEAAAGDWSQYVIAPLARLRAEYPDAPFVGLNCLLGGNVPIASGLSSSSAVVVATMEAAAFLNRLDLTPERFVELCGEGEWYVGTRGGAGDHGAMKFARRGDVVQVGFFPFRLVTTVPFPSDYMLLVCHSGIHARKTVGAKDIFNHRVACYQIGRELFKQEFPAYADRITHLRDLDPAHLGVSYPDFVAMLARLPEQMDRDQLIARLDEAFCRRVFATHDASMRRYQVRPVVLYGLAEIARGKAAPEVLAHGHAAEFGQWMNRSHDGDRVVQWAGKEPRPFLAACDDAALAALAARARV
ncbi:MAG TPA: NTP transferase domain-containing protein, partial [Armatimonadota bacterium]|nr:NTP transferase domain-containing protein [Armatimonadota bacterium]